MDSEHLTRRLDELGRRLDQLPETAEPPPTTLQLLNRSRQEGDWQQYLAYFLDPQGSHGIGHAALEQFLGRDVDVLEVKS